MSKIPVCVIGLGKAGSKGHLPAYHAHPDTEVVAVCDTDTDSIQEVKKEFNVPDTYDSPEKLFSNINFDIISICTPPSTHLALVEAAMNKGVDVLLEKPMAPTHETASSLENVVAESEQKFSVVHNQKFSPGVHQATSCYRDGSIGEIQTVDITKFIIGSDDPVVSNQSHWAHQLSGGRWVECIPHDLYTSFQFADGMAVEDVTCKKMSDKRPWLDSDHVVVTLTTDGGFVTIRYFVNEHVSSRQQLVQGTRGHISFDRESAVLVPKSSDDGGISGEDEAVNPATRTPFEENEWTPTLPHKIQISKFINYVCGSGENPVSHQEAFTVNRLAAEVANRITTN